MLKKKGRILHKSVSTRRGCKSPTWPNKGEQGARQSAAVIRLKSSFHSAAKLVTRFTCSSRPFSTRNFIDELKRTLIMHKISFIFSHCQSMSYLSLWELVSVLYGRNGRWKVQQCFGNCCLLLSMYFIFTQSPRKTS